MSYAYINREYMKNKPNFWLCLPYPRRTGMRKLTEIYNVNFKLILGRVHELSFDIPAKVERNNELIKNPLIQMFNGYYLVKMEWNGQTEYFVYVKGNRKLDNSGKNLSYKLYSTAYLIGKKGIPIYEEESLTLRQHAEFFLQDTNWKIGVIDDYFEVNKNVDAPRREMNATQTNALQCLYDLCEKFDAIMKFDTVNHTVSFLKPENTGINKGMIFKEGIFLETLGQEIDFDSIVTRLHVYGSDGLEFRRLSLTGVNYLQDLSWFIYPFQQNINGDVIKSSKWLTDGFCINYKKYQKALIEAQPIFANILNLIEVVEDELRQLDEVLFQYETELNQIENSLWVINKTYKEEAPLRQDWKELTQRRSNSQNLIARAKLEIETRKITLDRYNQDILYLRQNLLLENFFTPSQIEEFNASIHHGYYTNDAITDESDLLEDGKKAFEKMNRPPITLNIGIVNFSNDIEHERLRDRIALGDTVRVKSEDLDIFFSLKIIEIDYNMENDSISLTISNENDLRDDMAKLVDQIYTSSHTSNTVNVNKPSWDKGNEAMTEVDKILNNAWDAAKNSIVGGYENLTVLDKYGLKSIESGDSNTFLFINNGIFSITRDNANSIEVAIDKNGVHARVVVGDLILGNNLKLTSVSGILEADGETLTIRDSKGNKKVELGKYKDPSNNQFTYGLNIIGGAINIRTSENSNEGTVINKDGITVYDNNGNKVFTTTDPSNINYSGNITGDVTIDIDNGISLGGDLILKDSSGFTNTVGRINYYNTTMNFFAEDQFIFNNDVYVLGDIYSRGKKVVTQ